MNENVNISFIPKKPLARDEAVRRRRPLLTVSFLISFIVASVAIGASVVQFIRIETVEQERVETIEKLKVYNDKLKKDGTLKEIKEKSAFVKQIAVVSGLLNRHVASTELFAFLERTTPKQVSFDNFNLKKTEDAVKLTMKGQTVSYEALAALSQLYKKEKGILIDYTLTNFSLTDKGRISFDFTGIFDPYLIDYTSSF